jgi:hypothetical protein
MRRISTYLLAASVLASLLASLGIGQKPGQVQGPEYAQYSACKAKCPGGNGREAAYAYDNCLRSCAKQFPEAFVTPLRSMTAKVVQLGTDANGPTVKAGPQSVKLQNWIVVKAADSETGKPIDGRVYITSQEAGQAFGDGQTGQKFYYQCEGKVGVSKKPGIEGKTVSSCPGKVTAPGYSPGLFVVEATSPAL